MDEKIYYLLGIILGLIVVPEARVIKRRALPKDDSSGKEEIPFSFNPLDKDNKLGDSPGIWDQPTRDDAGIYEYDAGVNDPRGQPSGDKVDNNRPGKLKPEKFSTAMKKPKEKDGEDVDTKHDVDKSKDEGFYEPFDDSNEEVDKDRKPSVPVDENKSIRNDKDMSRGNKGVHEREPEEYDDDKKKNEPKDRENDKDDDEKNADNEDDEDEKYAPEDNYYYSGDDDEDTREDQGFFNMDSFFDNPFFNLKQVKKYFGQLDRALQHVFRQTVEEAMLLNGTFANTTEEEVDIHGKKYIVQKSIIRGGDNHSSIYVEALSSKSKNGNTERKKYFQMKNETWP